MQPGMASVSSPSAFNIREGCDPSEDSPSASTSYPLIRRHGRCCGFRKELQRRWYCTKQFFRRIDVCWTLLFFLLLFSSGSITTAFTQILIKQNLLQSLHTLHRIHMNAVFAKMSAINKQAQVMGAGYLSLRQNRLQRVNSETELALLCATLDHFRDSRFTAALLYSMREQEAAGCMRGVFGAEASTVLGGFASQHHIVNYTYRVNDTTYEFAQPPQVVAKWPSIRQNFSQTLATVYAPLPLFKLVEGYYNGIIDSIDVQYYWESSPTIPHFYLYRLPVGVLARGVPLQPGQYADDFMEIFLDGSKILEPRSTRYLGFSAAAFLNSSLTDPIPLIFSNNWGQQSVSNNSLFAPLLGPPVEFLTIAKVTDPLMKAALKHVDFPAMQIVGYNHSVDFTYKGAYATVTANTYITKGGFIVPLVFVSGHTFVKIPYMDVMNTCTYINAAVVVAFTALFWWFVHNEYSRPLERMTALLLESLETGKRSLLRTTRHTYVQLKESADLIHAFNNFVRQLRHIDTFIPRDVRQRFLQLQHRLSMHSDQRDDHPDVLVEMLPKIRHRSDTLQQHHLTMVHVTVQSPAQNDRAESTVRDLLDGPSATLVRFTRPGQHLAAVVERAAHAGSVANSGPFASAAALEAFATAVHDLAARHRGVVRNLTPEGCAVHFAAGVRAHLRKPMAPRTTEAAASASATAAVCGAGPAYDAEALRAHIDADARDALAFALALQQWVDAACGDDAAGMPDVRSLVDTGVFTCGAYRAPGSEQTLSVALGRDAQREVGGVPAALGVRVAMTEETAVRVRPGRCAATEPGVRQLPVEALRTGRAGLDGNAVILYEVLPGAAGGDATWLRYSLCCFDGFECMVRGDYAGALRAYKGMAEISDLEPGLLPASLRREAASSDVSGGAVSVQVQRLMRECERRVAAHVTTRYYRERRSPYAIDTVLRALPLQQRVGEEKPAARRAMSRARSQASSPSKSVLSDALRVRQCSETVRHVIIVRTISGDIPCVLGKNPRRLVDCTGTWWRISNSPMESNPRERWSAHWIALGSAGSMCIASILPFRELQPIVAKAIAGAPRGPMCDRLRSAVPVHDATPKQRRAIEQLFVGRRRLEHPNLLSFSAYSLSVEGGVVLMKNFAPGGTLRELLGRYQSTNLRTLANIGLCILSGLTHLHGNGCVHGAVSLDNAMVGGDGQCRLRGYFVDYALAQATFLLPCTCYVSPAMAAGHAPTPACDMFCYGLLILEALSGKKPWVWAPVEDFEEHGTEEELAALIAAGGPAFCEAVVNGRVVADVVGLASACRLRNVSPPSTEEVCRCLSINPVQRPTAVDLWYVTVKFLNE